MNFKPVTVLLLDDDPNLRRVLTDILKAKGFESVPMDSGAAALAFTARQDIDVALIDVNLAEGSGLEVLRGIKAHSPETECIMLTGHGSQTTAVEAINLGAYSYFQKPYEVDQLLVAIQRAAEKRFAGHFLRESEARFRSLIENSSDLIAILNPDATLGYVSPSIQRLMDYSPAEIVAGTGLQEYIHPDDLSAFIEAYTRCLQASDSTPVSLQLRLRHKDGSWRTLEGTGRNLIDHPAISGIVINAHDVSDRIRADIDIIESEIRYRSLFENVPDGVYSSTLSGKFLSVNQALVKIFGYSSAEELLKVDIASNLFIHPEARQSWADALLQKGELHNTETIMRRKDGQTIVLLDNSRVIFNPQGEPVCFEGTLIDITERKQAEDRLTKLYDCFLKFGSDPVANINLLVAFAGEVFSATCALYNQLQGKMLCSLGTWNTPKDYRPLGPSEGHICTDVIKSGNDEIVIIRNLQDSPYALTDPNVSQYKLQTYVGKPVKFGKFIVGSLCIVFQNDYIPAEDDKRMLGIIASAMGVEEKRKREALLKETLYQVLSVVSTQLDTDLVVHSAVETIVRLAGYPHVCIVLPDESGEHWVVHGAAGSLAAELGASYPIHHGVIGRAFKTGKTQWVRDILDDPDYVREVNTVDAPALRSEVVAILRRGDHLFGTLNIESVIADAFDDADVRMMESVADIISLALENARSYREAQQEITRRKQAETALLESKSSLQAVLQSTADGILAVGLENEVLYANDRFAELWRIPPAVMAGRDDTVLLQYVLNQLSDPHSFSMKVQKLYKSKKESFDTLDFKDGRVFERVSRPLLQGTELSGRVWTFRDITGRRQAERLQDAIYRIARAADQADSPDKLYPAIHGIIQETMVANNFYIALYDASKDLLSFPYFVDEQDSAPAIPQKPGKGLTEYVLHTSKSVLCDEELYQSLIQAGEIDLVGVHSPVWLGVPLIAEGKAIGVMVVQDYQNSLTYGERERGILEFVSTQVAMTIHRKQAEEAMRENENRLRTIVEGTQALLVNVDADGHFTYVNDATARAVGYASPEELIGKSYLHFIHPEDRQQVLDTYVTQAKNRQLSNSQEFRIIDSRGKVKWFRFLSTLVLNDNLVIGQSGVALEITNNKRAEQEIRRRVADLEVLYDNGLSISVLLDPRQIARKMIAILSKKLDWHHITIRIYHPENEHVELLAVYEPGLDPGQTRAEIDRLNKVFTSLDIGLSGWVIKHGRTVRSADVQADVRYHSTFPGIHSGLYVPLMVGNKAIGAISVESRQKNRFSKEDEHLLQTLAAQSAIAFENARLYQEAIGASKRKAALHQAGMQIVRAGEDIEALSLALHQATTQVMPVDIFVVSLITTDDLVVETPYYLNAGLRLPKTRLLSNAAIAKRVIKSKKSLLIKDVHKSRGPKPVMENGVEPAGAILSVPLLTQERVVGVLSVQSHETEVYNNEDRIFLETLASEAAVAFENSRLFEETRRRLAELESLSQVSVFLTSATDLQPLLENILAGARKAIPAAEKGTILLAGVEGALRVHAMSGYSDPRIMNLILPDQGGYAIQVARMRTPMRIDDVHAGYEIPYQGTIAEMDAIQSSIAAPLTVKDKVIGVISLDNASHKAAFTESNVHLLGTFASSAAVAIENARLFSETRLRLHRLTALHSIDAAIGASMDTHVTLSIVLDHVMSDLEADAAAVLLFNPLTRMLEYASGRGFRLHVVEGLRLRLGENLAGQSVLQRRPINITDLQQSEELKQWLLQPVNGSPVVPLQYLDGENFIGYHAIPLIAKGQVQGVLEIFKRSLMPVDQEWITFFELLAGQTAIALDNDRLFETLQHSNLELTLAYDATIQGWSQALELRDEDTEGHTLRVTDLTMQLFQAMGIDETESEHARRGSLLHDIGKIAVPDKILLKPGPLDENELIVMRRHPQFAYDLLAPIAYLRPALTIPWCHHEKWDGSGYPRGIKGEEIPLVARIFALADVFDALISNRPYRPAWTRENALDYIREQSGKQFDPKVVKVFLTLMAGK